MCTFGGMAELMFSHKPRRIFLNVKPAAGRPYVPAFRFLTPCQSLRAIVCVFTRRRKFDLCVSASSIRMLAFENNASCSSSACSTPAFCRR